MTRLSATSLMVGDWVYGLTNPMEGPQEKVACKVIRLETPDEVFTTAPGYIVDEEEIDDWEWYDIEPIPITPEILENNGFVYNNLPFIQGWQQHGLTIFDEHITCGENISMEAKYVHQLQHVLKLCGIEKEIVL